jgi:hypothetical protein
MMDNAENDGRRPGTRPFVSGRPVAKVDPITLAPSRPFSFTGAKTKTGAGLTTTTSVTIDPRSATPTPRWTVAVYEPGLERSVPADSSEPPAFVPAPSAPTPASGPADSTDDFVEASLALQDDVIEAGRHAASAAAAEVLELVAKKLRRGEILLLPGAATSTDTGAVSAVLAALLGGRRP